MRRAAAIGFCRVKGTGVRRAARVPGRRGVRVRSVTVRWAADRAGQADLYLDVRPHVNG